MSWPFVERFAKSGFRSFLGPNFLPSSSSSFLGPTLSGELIAEARREMSGPESWNRWGALCSARASRRRRRKKVGRRRADRRASHLHASESFKTRTRFNSALEDVRLACLRLARRRLSCGAANNKRALAELAAAMGAERWPPPAAPSGAYVRACEL